MTPDRLVTVTVSALLAAVPLEAVLFVRLGRTRRGAPLSPGRFLLFYAATFGLVLSAARPWGLPGALTVAGLIAGVQGAGRGVRSMYRMLYGGRWLSAHPDIVRDDVGRWQLVLLVIAVCFITAAVALMYAPGGPGAGL